jgi:predicted CXXCH cytochrome family protein
MFKGKNIHKPVKDGNCGLCHDPHASDYDFRLTDFQANLCVGCHDSMVTGMTSKHIHEPLLETGCTDCHDPHAGEDSVRLKKSSEEICFQCHKEKKTEVDQYTNGHEPAVKGQCISCHSPHFSDNSFLLLDKQNTLCYSCHKESEERDSRKFKHGPVVQGNCTACHSPHGSDNANILRLALPHKFYSAYEKGKYDLCFFCHKEAMVTVKETTTVTNFRNGEKNLHWFHVNQKKGRTCRACHDVHASNHEGRIRDEFPFGNMSIPMEYSQTETGGSCLPGCHREMSYDRVNSVPTPEISSIFWRPTSGQVRSMPLIRRMTRGSSIPTMAASTTTVRASPAPTPLPSVPDLPFCLNQ